MKINFKLTIILLLVAFAISSCGNKKRVVTSKRNKTSQNRPAKKPEKETPVVIVEKPAETATIGKTSTGDVIQDYINDFREAAMSEQKLYGIPASITLAQGIHESGAGRSRLATEANNHFGIKCHTEWTGARIYHDDDSDQECFRKYNDATYSYRDHSLFLTERKRYADLFELAIDDYEGWANGLRKAGYATDRRYPEKLIKLIENYELWKYDQLAMGSMEIKKPVKKTTTTEITHVVIKGDTLYALSKIYDTTVDELKRLNQLSDDTLDLGQVLRVK
jgi:flagellum-specific peptidoglycan hydrolase FlgJ